MAGGVVDAGPGLHRRRIRFRVSAELARVLADVCVARGGGVHDPDVSVSRRTVRCRRSRLRGCCATMEAGACVGSAVTGMRPIGEIQFSDFVVIAMDQIGMQGAKMRFMFGGKAELPFVIF